MNKVLLIIFFVSVSMLSAVSLEESLAAYWQFDTQSNTSTSDLTSYGNTAYVSGSTWSNSGKFGGAYDFDGVDDYLYANDASILRVTNAVTLSAWIFPRAYTYPGQSYAGIIAKSNSPRSYSLYSIDSGLHLSTAGQGSSISAPGYRLNQWNHVVGVIIATPSGGQHLYYVNGVLVAQISLPGLTSLPGNLDVENVLIGKTYEASRNFNGLIDEVAIWNRALDTQEVDLIYNTYGGSVMAYQQVLIPEPTSLILLSLAVLLFIKRR